MKKNKFRLSFPEDEKLHNWLPMLLNSYAIMDEGVKTDIENVEKLGKKLACKRGCSSCCYTHRDIPVYPIEIVGIYWYVIEKVKDPMRLKIKRSLISHKRGEGCPFLIDSVCSIYPVRPLACRQFNVFGKPCTDGEDPYYTRPEDVLKPREPYLGRALYETTPFYDVYNKDERVEFLNSGKLNSLVKILQNYPWIELTRRMDS
ncbi:MAG TPA: YkgJ family cysteine cluster protein [Thermodesulfovibrio thiophilus]|uniref:YkgJ family cysteine cluster protein n=1 Tax=Thermodesulfovibrio thiophilus TaxID=340095 RepID=UPI002356007A|nr:YkgJ family cysteine cluster protein [Thermodesulfovibrio thiophilus]HOA82748.1 YkgJ family cysteine cluster protein [Thermodesulfovibrio thiophilus]HQA03562.1 YkgJ family cysteine cluster protein [Thermodesulfovibrio thiophilus]HQD36318.1 YkgJ family cysteine cluster protein [Thermodesulfovibrio thiophilus]